MEINGVKIGDQFMHSPTGKYKKESVVIDFIERRSLATGEVIGYECIAQHEFLGQMVTKTVPFATVLRNKFNEKLP